MSEDLKYEYHKNEDMIVIKNISKLNDLGKKESSQNIKNINLICKNIHNSKTIEIINKNREKELWLIKVKIIFSYMIKK